MKPERRECLPNNDSALSGEALLQAIAFFARGTQPKMPSKRLWDSIAKSLTKLPDPWKDLRLFDEWFVARQAVDPAQKSRGAYVTPFSFAERITRLTLTPFHGKKIPNIIDPSVGTGVFLLAALDFLRQRWPEHGIEELVSHLYGADIDSGSRELCCGLLWIACGGQCTMEQIANNVVVANAITRCRNSMRF